MPLTRAQKIALVDEALRDHFPWEGEGVDTRTLGDLRKMFEERHLLGGLVNSYQATLARRGAESITSTDIDAA